MEINASTTGERAADALLGTLVAPETPVPSELTDEQRQDIHIAVGALLSQAGIAATDPVEVHFAADPEGKWAVLRVASIIREP